MLQEIDLTTTGFLSSSTTALLKRSNALTSLIPADHPFFSIEAALKGKADFSQEKRNTLVAHLRDTYTRLGIANRAEVSANIEALLEPDTYTVTTGQQLHLFLGPAFMLYKLISVIKAAEHYAQLYPGKKFVPVYWLASEDHDFEEIKATPLFGQKYLWETTQSGACGTYHLNDLPVLFDQLKQKLVNDVRAMQLLSDFEALYAGSANLSDATIRLTHQLFCQYGLVCLDANHHALKQLFKPVIEKELNDSNSDAAFNAFSEQMEHNGLSLQLKGRPINLFYLKEGLRARIERKDGAYSIAGTDIRFTSEEMMDEVNRFPEHFSPNAVLRPIYQETILPNVAYVGGNAEINYWLQLKTVFDLYQTGAPVLLLRQSAWLIKQKQLDWLNSKNINFNNLFGVHTESDLLTLLNPGIMVNPFEELLEKFDTLKTETLDTAGKNNLKNIRETAEAGKQFEKQLKELIKLKNEQLSESSKKDIIKLEQLINNGFNKNSLQERTIYLIEFLINSPEYIKNCLETLSFKPGTGYFLLS